MHLWSSWRFFLGIYVVPQVTMSPQRSMLSYLGQFLVFFYLLLEVYEPCVFLPHWDPHMVRNGSGGSPMVIP